MLGHVKHMMVMVLNSAYFWQYFRQCQALYEKKLYTKQITTDELYNCSFVSSRGST